MHLKKALIFSQSFVRVREGFGLVPYVNCFFKSKWPVLKLLESVSRELSKGVLVKKVEEKSKQTGKK